MALSQTEIDNLAYLRKSLGDPSAQLAGTATASTTAPATATQTSPITPTTAPIITSEPAEQQIRADQEKLGRITQQISPVSYPAPDLTKVSVGGTVTLPAGDQYIKKQRPDGSIYFEPVPIKETKAAFPPIGETPPTPTTPPIGVPPTTRALFDYNKYYEDAARAMDESTNKALAMLDKSMQSMDAATQAMIADIRENYNRRKQKMQRVNEENLALLGQAGIRAGRQRYAPEFSREVLSSEEQSGLGRIAELEREEVALIQQAQTANDEKKYRLLSDRLDAVERTRREKQDLFLKLRDQSLQEEKFLEDRLRVDRDVEFRTAQLTKLNQDIRENALRSVATLLEPTLADYEARYSEAATDEAKADIYNQTSQWLISKVQAQGLAPTEGNIDALLSAIQQTRQEAPTGAKEVYSEPYRDPLSGQIVQRNIVTNEVRPYYTAPRAAVSAVGGIAAPTAITITPEQKPYMDAFNNAVIGLTQASQRIATTTFNNYMANNDLEGARAFLVRVATQGLPAADQTQALGRSQATATLQDIQALLNQAKQRGAATNIISGTLVNVAQMLGASPSEDLSYIGARIQQQLQVYRRSMTGVAFSPMESREYAKIFPDITNLSGLNTAKIKALVDAFDSNNRASLSFLLGGDANYNAIFGKPKLPTLPSAIGETRETRETRIYNGQTYIKVEGGWQLKQ